MLVGGCDSPRVTVTHFLDGCSHHFAHGVMVAESAI